jgi:hypothetical protein
MLDRAFFVERAAHCRALAERADPFIKHRLLDLAARYAHSGEGDHAFRCMATT